MKLSPLLDTFFIMYKILCDDELLSNIKKDLKFLPNKK